MNIQNYHKQQIIAWLSYNPYFESRTEITSDNRVCYIYPRFLFSNGRYIPIDNKQDFPQVGRVAVRIQGQDNAEDVYNRFGPIVSCRINTIPSPKYDANNFYTLRYNPQYGREGSEIWIDRIDGNAFYQILNTHHTIENIKNNPEIEVPFDLDFCSNNIILRCENNRIYGPFDYTPHEGWIQLRGLEKVNYMVGGFDLFDSNNLSEEILTFLDQNDQATIEVLPTSKLPSPEIGVEKIDMIDQHHLLELFLDMAKLQLQSSRTEFREIRDYCDKIINGEHLLDLNEERYNKLKRDLLPRLFSQSDIYRNLLQFTISSDEMRKHLIADITKTNGNELIRSLPSSMVNEIRAAINSKIADIIKPNNSVNEANTNLTGISINENVFNFLTNPQIKSALENIVNQSEQLQTTLNIINSNAAFLKDPEADQEYVRAKKEMYPDNIEIALKIGYELTNFINNIHIITRGAVQSEDTKEQKRFKDYINLSNSLAQIRTNLSEQCDLLKNNIENYKLNKDNLPAIHANEPIPKHTTNTKSQPLPDNLLHNVSNTNTNQINSAMTVPELPQIVAARELEQELSAKHAMLQNNIQQADTHLKQIQEDIKQKEQEFIAAQEKVSNQNKLSQEIMKKLQTSVDQYQEKAQIAIKLLDSSIINTLISGAGGEINSNFKFTNLNSTEAEAAASVAAGVNSTSNEKDGEAPKLALPNTRITPFNTHMLASNSDIGSATQLIERIADYINNEGNRNLSFNDVANYLICLTQGFITTIAGEPGTGKTSMCNLLANALGLKRPSNPRFIEVAVERGWTSLKDLIGYYNPLTKRMEKSNAEIFDAFFNLNLEAQFAPDGDAYDPSKIAPYLILLDEANLSPIEHYWAAFFRNCDLNGNGHRSISLGGNATWLLPEHLRFLATVNFDHTTEELSARFLDRSWVITLEPTSIQLDSDDDLVQQEIKMVSFATLQQAFNRLDHIKMDETIAEKWQTIQRIFASEQCALPIRPRNLMMVHNYCIAAQQCMQRNSPNTRYAPLDYAIAQKILPTINGTGERYKQLIDELLKECNEQYMPLCAKHLQRIQRNGGADLGFYQFFAR